MTSIYDPRPEPTTDWRAPSQYSRCRSNNGRCPNEPVVDLARGRTRRWWAYCAAHLREYNREVRGDRVWWLGVPRRTAHVDH